MAKLWEGLKSLFTRKDRSHKTEEPVGDNKQKQHERKPRSYDEVEVGAEGPKVADDAATNHQTEERKPSVEAGPEGPKVADDAATNNQTVPVRVHPYDEVDLVTDSPSLHQNHKTHARTHPYDEVDVEKEGVSLSSDKSATRAPRPYDEVDITPPGDDSGGGEKRVALH